MTNIDHIQGSLKAKRALDKKQAKPILTAQSKSSFGYLVGSLKNKLKVAKNAAMALTVGASGLFLQSCATSSAPMGMNNLTTRHGYTTTNYTYTAGGQIASRTTQYSEYDALDMARIQREQARANRENANAFRTMGQGVREFGKGIEAWRKAFDR